MQRWWAFLPYGVVGVVHLAALATATEAVAQPSKSLLMPALLFALLIAIPARKGSIALLAGAGVLLSWGGDVLLSLPGDVGFVAGLGCFLLAHIAYLVLFLRPLRRRRMPWLALLVIPWWAGLIVFLTPHLGVLLVPVVLYGLVLGASTAASLGTNVVTAAGGILFLVSDTVLAFKLFWPDFSLWQADVLVMLPYILGQGLIALGAILAARGVFVSAVREKNEA